MNSGRDIIRRDKECLLEGVDGVLVMTQGNVIKSKLE